MSERKAVIKNADMSEEMQQDAIDCATQVRKELPIGSLDRLVSTLLAASRVCRPT